MNGADASATLRPVKDDVARAMGIAQPTLPVDDAQWQQLLDSWAWSMAMCTHPMCTPAGNPQNPGRSRATQRGACGVPVQNSSAPSSMIVIMSHEMAARGFSRRFIDFSF